MSFSDNKINHKSLEGKKDMLGGKKKKKEKVKLWCRIEDMNIIHEQSRT